MHCPGQESMHEQLRVCRLWQGQKYIAISIKRNNLLSALINKLNKLELVIQCIYTSITSITKGNKNARHTWRQIVEKTREMKYTCIIFCCYVTSDLHAYWLKNNDSLNFSQFFGLTGLSWMIFLFHILSLGNYSSGCFPDYLVNASFPQGNLPSTFLLL